jgi:hypothetical protein
MRLYAEDFSLRDSLAFWSQALPGDLCFPGICPEDRFISRDRGGRASRSGILRQSPGTRIENGFLCVLCGKHLQFSLSFLSGREAQLGKGDVVFSESAVIVSLGIKHGRLCVEHVRYRPFA